MKIAAIINTINQAKQIKDLVSAFIIPINNYSINYECTFDIQSIKEIKKLKKEIFVSINKNIHNDEIESLQEMLLEIDKHNINGIIFYDIAIINLKHTLKLKTPLVWGQEHLTTNYVTANYWSKKGIEYVYLSSELTKKEMDEITKNIKIKTFVNVFGYLPMFTSKRNLVQNYLEYFNLKDKNKTKTIYKEQKKYIIKDTKHGTTVYSNYILNALDLNFTNYNYIVFNSNFIKEEDFYDTLLNYNNKQKNYKYPFEHGFLEKETIYKVRNDV